MELVEKPTQPNGTAPPQRKRTLGRRLRSPENLRQLVASQIRAIERSDLSVKEKARLLTPLARELREAISMCRRLDEMERQVEEALKQHGKGRCTPTAVAGH